MEFVQSPIDGSSKVAEDGHLFSTNGLRLINKKSSTSKGLQGFMIF